jgi:class 3 adenylate cyclase
MSLKDLRAELDEEVSSILSPRFQIGVTDTDTVPSADDPAITFPNRDNNTQGTKLINTCVLYIDIRRSTELNFSHRATTVAKLYSAFIRAMTRVARYHKGHVRGIIGDRLMVIFDRRDAFVNAVHCAISMNTVSQHIINRHFKANEVTCGIGIDAGNMLTTKTGVRRHGSEQGNYRNLVWLGRPANIASKLTDIANKPSESVEVDVVHVAYEQQYAVDVSTPPGLTSFNAFTHPPPVGGLGALSTPPPFGGFGALSTPPSFGGLGMLSNPFSSRGALDISGDHLSSYFETTNGQPAEVRKEWKWEKETPKGFLSNLEIQYVPPGVTHKNPGFQSFFVTEETQLIRPKTPPILMTGRVWGGFQRERPNSAAVKQSLFKKIKVSTPVYSGDVYGGNAIFGSLKE